jgi:Domain of unknown function (DUF4129)
LVGLWWARRRWRQTRAAARPLPTHLRRLEAILRRAGYGWATGKTAREYVRGVGEVLRAAPATVSVAEIPERVVSAYYAERFGGRLTGADERKELDEALGRLAGAI